MIIFLNQPEYPPFHAATVAVQSRYAAYVAVNQTRSDVADRLSQEDMGFSPRRRSFVIEE